MVLMAVIGSLGAGKTLALTYLAWRNFRKGLKVYSNYDLKIPYVPVKSTKDVLKMQEGFFAGDELWHWLDSRASMKKKNQVVGNFLLTSRKRGVNFAFTTQTFGQIDVRIRRVCDFIAMPQLTVDERVCRLMIFSHPSLQFIKLYKFRTQPIFELYDTNEVVDSLPDEDENMDNVQKRERDRAKKIRTETWESGDADDEGDQFMNFDEHADDSIDNDDR